MQQTLAQLVRAKYPGAYDDLSDQQLESAVRAKFPGQYDDLPSSPVPAQTPTAPPAPTAARGTGYRPNQPASEAVGGFVRGVGKMAPVVGSIAGAAVSGGASIPVQMLATGGGAALGQAVKDAPSDLPASDRFSNMAFQGLGNALLQGAAGAVSAAAPRLAQGARNLWNRGAKVTEPIAKQTQTMRAGGSLAQGKDEIAETVLSQGAGTIRQANADALKNTINEIDDAIDQVVANSKGMVSRKELRDALKARYQSIQPGTQAGEAERAALEASFRLLSQAPVKMTVKVAQQMKRDIYRAYEKTFAAGASEAAKAMADKTTARALRGAIRREEPAVAAADDALSKLIPASKAMDKAVSRTSNHNLVGLSQMLAGVAPNPGTVAAALINHPKISSFTAQQIYNAAQKLPIKARTAANILRMAQGLFGSEDQ